ncbi:hypothetical protein PR048_004034 [Dryococelus australis]|uniref:Uncharacterized protein n=1 Tax=Dryococelus australis TaxID=614101 RepID=A0ABQ9I4B2_9NEOP|nr:hypothetical protein PR048_004034 [Dryococelus australis]
MYGAVGFDAGFLAVILLTYVNRYISIRVTSVVICISSFTGTKDKPCAFDRCCCNKILYGGIILYYTSSGGIFHETCYPSPQRTSSSSGFFGITCPTRLVAEQLKTAPQKQSIGTHKTPHDPVKLCRERKINIKEGVNVDVFRQNKRPCPRDSHGQPQPYFCAILLLKCDRDFASAGLSERQRVQLRVTRWTGRYVRSLSSPLNSEMNVLTCTSKASWYFRKLPFEIQTMATAGEEKQETLATKRSEIPFSMFKLKLNVSANDAGCPQPYVPACTTSYVTRRGELIHGSAARGTLHRLSVGRVAAVPHTGATTVAVVHDSLRISNSRKNKLHWKYSVVQQVVRLAHGTPVGCSAARSLDWGGGAKKAGGNREWTLTLMKWRSTTRRAVSVTGQPQKNPPTPPPLLRGRAEGDNRKLKAEFRRRNDRNPRIQDKRQDTAQSTVGSYSFSDWLKHVPVHDCCLCANHKGQVSELRNPEWLGKCGNDTSIQWRCDNNRVNVYTVTKLCKKTRIVAERVWAAMTVIGDVRNYRPFTIKLDSDVLRYTCGSPLLIGHVSLSGDSSLPDWTNQNKVTPTITKVDWGSSVWITSSPGIFFAKKNKRPPINEHFTITLSNHVKSSHKGSDLTSMQQPMEKRRWLSDRPIMNAVKYRVVSCVVWANRTMVSSNTRYQQYWCSCSAGYRSLTSSWSEVPVNVCTPQCVRLRCSKMNNAVAKLDSTVMCILEPQMFVQWLLPQRVASVTSHLAVWHSLLASLQVCYWLRAVQGLSNKLLSNCKVNFSVKVFDVYIELKRTREMFLSLFIEHRIFTHYEGDLQLVVISYEEVWAVLNIEVLRADGGEMKGVGSSAGMKGRGKRKIPEKTRRPAASSGTIPTSENPDVNFGVSSAFRRSSYGKREQFQITVLALSSVRHDKCTYESRLKKLQDARCKMQTKLVDAQGRVEQEPRSRHVVTSPATILDVIDLITLTRVTSDLHLTFPEQLTGISDSGDLEASQSRGVHQLKIDGKIGIGIGIGIAVAQAAAEPIVVAEN